MKTAMKEENQRLVATVRSYEDLQRLLQGELRGKQLESHHISLASVLLLLKDGVPLRVRWDPDSPRDLWYELEKQEGLAPDPD